MLNHIVLMGRLTADPILRRTSKGTAVAEACLAVERDYSGSAGGKETDFINIVVWGGTAEFFSKYFSKGQMAVVSGRFQIRPWEDKKGNKQRTAEVVAENIYFGEAKKRDAYQGPTYEECRDECCEEDCMSHCGVRPPWESSSDELPM